MNITSENSVSKTISFLAFLLVTIKTCSISPLVSGIVSFSNLWVIFGGLSIFIGLFKGKYIKSSKLYFALICWCLLGLLVVQPPAYFKSYPRLGLFTFNLLLLTPLLQNIWFQQLRLSLLKYSIVAVNIVVTLSFFAYFLGINLASKMDPNDVQWGFGGITNQSMTLAPCAGIAFLYDLWRILFTNFRKKHIRLIYIILIFMSVWIVLVAGSRGALIATLCGAMFMLLKLKSKGKTYFTIVLLFLISVILLPSSIYEKATYSMNRKMEGAYSTGSMTSSRDDKWEARLTEFQEQPIFGVGFASQTHFTYDDNKSWIEQTGNIEPGSSWLAVLAMTGLGGIVLIIAINYQIIMNLFRRIDRINALLFISLLIFFILHGAIEGWIFAAGGYIFYLYWLLLGVCQIYLIRRETNIII